MKPSPTLYVVMPCYDEEDVLPITSGVMSDKMKRLMSSGSISGESRVLMVDDGSDDSTWDIIKELHDDDPMFTGMSFSSNRGHQNALYAGLMEALSRGCDIAISMDADLQDDVDAIDGMVSAYMCGSDIVYGVRDNRDTDTAFKRSTAHAFYGLMGRLGVDMVPDAADYRLMDRRALDALSGYGERDLFLRGIVPSLGFSTSKVFYKRGSRAAGESKYPLGKMVSLAADGIMSFSMKPIHAVSLVGMASMLVAIVMLVYTFVVHALGDAVSGWSSTMLSIWFLGGMMIFSLGMIGEYVGRIYMEGKHRPRYIVRERLS